MSTDSAAATAGGTAPTGRELALGAARAFAGAVLFALPLLMTEEMWTFGAVHSPERLALSVLGLLPVLVVLVRHLGFRDTGGLRLADHLADALVAFGIGAVTALVTLWLLGVVDVSRTLREVVGLVAIQAVPASIGAAIARSQFATGSHAAELETAGYTYELWLMAVGAAVFAFNVAPTREIVLLAGRIGPDQVIGVALVSVVALHAIVYLLGFRGQHRSEAPFWSVFVGYTLAGYAVTLVVALALLWVFGRTDGASAPLILREAVVLGVPGAVGAGAARLIL